MKIIARQLLPIILIISLVSSFKIKPLQAGSIQINDKQIKHPENINQLIALNINKKYYEEHKDINVLASITNLAMDDKLTFYFKYHIQCPQEICYLNFTFTKKIETINYNFTYHLTIDYLVAHGLVIKTHNMTSYQEHIMLKDVITYDQNNSRLHLQKNTPFNNQDALLCLLFPNGWNNLTLTGGVRYNYVIGTTMYVIHYMDPTNGHGQHDFQDWPQGKNQINYKALFIPQQYLQQYPDCIAKQQYKLTSKFDKKCNGGSSVKWFYGFKHTKQTQIKGQFFQQKSGFIFSLQSQPNRYGLLYFPFQTNSQFKDYRNYQYKYNQQKEILIYIFGFLIIAGVFYLIIRLFIIIARKLIMKSQNTLKEEKVETASKTQIDQDLQQNKNKK